MSQNIFKAFNDKHLKTGGPDTTANSMRALISPDKEKNICCIFVKIIDSKLRHTENHFYHKCRFSAVSEWAKKYNTIDYVYFIWHILLKSSKVYMVLFLMCNFLYEVTFVIILLFCFSNGSCPLHLCNRNQPFQSLSSASHFLSLSWNIFIEWNLKLHSFFNQRELFLYCFNHICQYKY